MPRRIAAITVAVGLTGCVAGPDYERPDLALPEEWPEQLDGRMTSVYDDDRHWWELYDDPILEDLVRQALDDNLDIEIAAARVTRARAVLGSEDAARFPSVDGTFEANREDPGLTGSEVDSEFILGGLLEYEVDLWGRLSRSREAARADLLGTAYARDAVELGVIGDLVTTYFSYRATQEQIEATQSAIASREDALELERTRLETGAATNLSVRQAEAELANNLARMPGLRRQASQQLRALAVLVGDTDRVLQGIENPGDAGLRDLPSTTADLPDIVPSALLLRRPDIRAAEAFLVSANARIGEARANWLPRVNLVTLLGTGAASVNNLFTAAADYGEITATATAPILDFGRRKAEVNSAEAERELAEQQYRQTIARALQEVGDAWDVLEAAEERVAVRRREIRALVEVARLAERRYLSGYVSYIEVLDARRALLDARLTMIEAARDRLLASATLFRALGGLHPDPEAIFENG